MIDLEVQGSLDRQSVVSSIQLRDRAEFKSWITDSKPFRELPSTVETLRYLISPRIWDFVEDPANLDVLIGVNDPNHIRFFVIEHTGHNLTNLESLKRHQEKLKLRFSRFSWEREGPPQLPEDVDDFHWNFIDDVLEGTIRPSDKIYNMVHLKSIGDELCVVAYGDRNELQRKGIATSFYQRLREIAKELGFKYVTGINGKGNVDFFKKKLGRVGFDQLPDDLRLHFGRHHGGDIEDDMDDEEEFTVDFINPEDKPVT